MVSQYLQKGIQRERVDLLKSKPQYPHHMVPTSMTTKVPFRPTFILTYNPHNPPLKGWLIEGYTLLKSDPKLMQIYPKPSSVTFRQAPSLRRILTQNRFRELPYRDLQDEEERPPGCHRHTHSTRGARCQLCPRLNVSSRFTSRYTGLSYKIRHRFDCKSRFCVYLVTCVEFECQYTGSTV